MRCLQIIIAINLLIAVCFAATTGSKKIKQMRIENIHKKALALGLIGAPFDVEERHVWITEHPAGPNRNGDINVHIMYRENGLDPWQFNGTGALLGKSSGELLTAYHVFEGFNGQFGYRKIGPNEFTGKEMIHPIVSCPITDGDDAVVCAVDLTGMDFPTLIGAHHTNMLHTTEKQKSTITLCTSNTVRFGTYPEKKIRTLMYARMERGAGHVTFDWLPRPGESGTVALIDGAQDPDEYLVIIRGHDILKEVIDKFPPNEVEVFNWTPDRVYGVGNRIKIVPKYTLK